MERTDKSINKATSLINLELLRMDGHLDCLCRHINCSKDAVTNKNMNLTIEDVLPNN